MRLDARTRLGTYPCQTQLVLMAATSPSVCGVINARPTACRIRTSQKSFQAKLTQAQGT